MIQTQIKEALAILEKQGYSYAWYINTEGGYLSVKHKETREYDIFSIKDVLSKGKSG